MKKTKNNKFKNTIELQLGSEEVLEFLDFLKVSESNGLRCSSATKIKSQLHEFVVARIEGRNPKAYVASTDDLISLMDQKSLQKLAFTDAFAKKEADYEKYKGAAPQEIVDTMNPPPAEINVSPGQVQSTEMATQRHENLVNRFVAINDQAKAKKASQ